MSEMERENGEVGVPEGARWAKGHHVLLYFLGAALVVWVLTGLYTVQANEVGIVERMGQFVSTDRGEAVLVEPGQHFGLPWPIDVVHHVAMKQTLSKEVTDFNTTSAATELVKKEWMRLGWPGVLMDALLDPYLITADKNVLHGKITVQYHITNAEKYLTCMAEKSGGKDWEKAAREAIGQVGAHMLIREMAQTPVDAALGDGKQSLMERIRQKMVPETEALGLGIQVDSVTLVNVEWPKQVDEAFKNAQSATARAKTLVEQALSYRNSQLTQAGRPDENGEPTGDAKRIVLEANAERTKVIAEAQGEAERFSQVYKQYKESPELTRTSLYADAVTTVLGNVTRTIFVQAGQKATVLIDAPEEKRPGGGGRGE